MNAPRVHRIATPDDPHIPEAKPKPPAGGTPVDSTSTVMPPGVRPGNSWEVALDQLTKQSGLL